MNMYRAKRRAAANTIVDLLTTSGGGAAHDIPRQSHKGPKTESLLRVANHLASLEERLNAADRGDDID